MSMWSNCWLWATLEWRRRVKQWRDEGMPKGDEPYWVERPSRSEPRFVKHRLVGRLNKDSGMLELESFKPLEPVDVPWWAAWTRLWFKGRVRRGDALGDHDIERPADNSTGEKP